MMNNLLENPNSLIIGVGLALYAIEKAYKWFKPDPLNELVVLLRDMKEKDTEERHEIKETLIVQKGILDGIDKTTTLIFSQGK